MIPQYTPDCKRACILINGVPFSPNAPMSRTLPVSSHRQPASGGPTAPIKLFVWDTGTTGTSPHDHGITAIAAIEYTPITSAITHAPAKFSTLVQPWNSRKTARKSSKTAPRLPHAFRQLAAFITEHTPRGHIPLLVAHNAAFDAAFLLAELQRAAIPTPEWLFADSLQPFRSLFPDLSSTTAPYSLDSLARHFEVQVPRRHNAEDDVCVLRDLLIIASDRLAARGEKPLRHTLRDDAEPLHHLAKCFVDQAVPSDTDPCLPYITTRNGRFFHMDEACRNLCSAKKLIRVEAPGPGLVRCYLCGDDEPSFAETYTKERAATTAYEHSSSSDTTDGRLSGFSGRNDDRPFSEENSVPAPFKKTPAGVSAPSTADETYITTRSGRFYHMDRKCKNLRSAKLLIPVTQVPAHLKACYVCCKHGEEVREKDDEQSITVAPAALDSASSDPRRARHGDSKTPKSCSEPERHDESIKLGHKRTYITTAYGRFYHMDRDCHNLRSAKKLIPVDKRPQHLTACYRCCSEEDLEDDDVEALPKIEEEIEDSSSRFAPNAVDSNKPAVPKP